MPTKKQRCDAIDGNAGEEYGGWLVIVVVIVPTHTHTPTTITNHHPLPGWPFQADTHLAL